MFQPLEEWKKKFWKTALGDVYKSPTYRPGENISDDGADGADDSECAPLSADDDDECVPPTQEQPSLVRTSKMDTASNCNYAQQLSDFIKNRECEQPSVSPISLPDTETQSDQFTKPAGKR